MLVTTRPRSSGMSSIVLVACRLVAPRSPQMIHWHSESRAEAFAFSQEYNAFAFEGLLNQPDRADRRVLIESLKLLQDSGADPGESRNLILREVECESSELEDLRMRQHSRHFRGPRLLVNNCVFTNPQCV